MLDISIKNTYIIFIRKEKDVSMRFVLRMMTKKQVIFGLPNAMLAAGILAIAFN